MEKDKIRERWTEYIQDLYNSDRGDGFEAECLDELPDIMTEEVRYALKKMKATKAAGPDELCV